MLRKFSRNCNFSLASLLFSATLSPDMKNETIKFFFAVINTTTECVEAEITAKYHAADSADYMPKSEIEILSVKVDGKNWVGELDEEAVIEKAWEEIENA
jgi:hypothetical protein